MTGGNKTTRKEAAAPAWQGPPALLRPLVLIGMPGSGKSAIGRALSARLGVPLHDSDAEIEAAAQASIAEIFARDGEAFFRAGEAKVIERLLAQRPPAVIATGGGAFLSPATRAAVAREGVSLWLDVALPVLWDRVRHKTHRPLLQTPDPRGRLAALLEERGPVYAEAALRIRVTREQRLDGAVEAVLAAIAAVPGLLRDPDTWTRSLPR